MASCISALPIIDYSRLMQRAENCSEDVKRLSRSMMSAYLNNTSPRFFGISIVNLELFVVLLELALVGLELLRLI